MVGSVGRSDFFYKPAIFSKLMDRQAAVVRNALVGHGRRSGTTLCVLNAKDWKGQDKRRRGM